MQAELRGGLLRADRIEFDTNFNTLYARGSVRLRRGSQYFQASTFRYSLIQNSGELKDVYGVLELDELSAGFQSSPKAVEPPSKQTLPVLESSGLGFPTALDMELGGRTAGQISDQPSGDGIWETELAPTPTWEVPEPGKPINQRINVNGFRHGLSGAASADPRLAPPPLGSDRVGRAND